jgi:hypothetical protein
MDSEGLYIVTDTGRILQPVSTRRKRLYETIADAEKDASKAGNTLSSSGSQRV